MTSPYPPGLARARRGLQSHQERGVVVIALLHVGRRRRPRGVELGRRHDVVEQRRVLADGADRRELRHLPDSLCAAPRGQRKISSSRDSAPRASAARQAASAAAAVLPVDSAAICAASSAAASLAPQKALMRVSSTQDIFT